MELLPVFHIAVMNGWLPLLIYGLGFILALMTFSEEARARLFEDPKQQIRGLRRHLLTVGQLIMVAYIILMVFTPLKVGIMKFVVGMIVYGLGYFLVVISLNYFKGTPKGQLVTRGPYQFSRNPQWLGLFLVLLGIAIATASWLHIAMVVSVGLIYHIQILEEEKLCAQFYGESYRNYWMQVPRYFLFL